MSGSAWLSRNKMELFQLLSTKYKVIQLVQILKLTSNYNNYILT